MTLSSSTNLFSGSSNQCDPTRKLWDDLIAAQIQLYTIAVALRQSSALDQFALRDELPLPARREIARLQEWEDKIFSDEKVYDAVNPGLMADEEMWLSHRSILANEEFFDLGLRGFLRECVMEWRDNFAGFRTCLSSRLATRARITSSQSLEQWLDPPPNLGWRSIAEELPYETDNSLSFLRPENSASVEEKLWPFQFRYEIAFPTTTPAGKEASSLHRTPWEFTSLRSLIANKVQAGVEADANLRALYQRVRNFTVLQRFFRTSLEGKLGEQYPIEKLASLMKATAGSLITDTTPRNDPATDKCRDR